ncbi:dimethylamine corrinoid protein 3 [Methanosarcina sp. KYL-1]|uniref:corrinoid protein n=1 Tax=Methanosarcina sp. KYL-1 TaxID=2602068 RepID=UPI00210191A0|nr:B12-binding domain-containing protein [Methanosarcina sp. KYL-1]MCQ1534402.1 dimethylamine corrinoid protein 3 [Methanosarcina sp. KYL-1]
MATKEEIIARAKAAVLDFDDEAAEEVAQEALDAGINVIEIIENGFSAALGNVGERFESGELFLPHLIAASDAMGAGMKVLAPAVEGKIKGEKIAKVVLGTIEGDIHSIGKDIVAAMLKIAGFEVIDLGRDVPIDKYLSAAKENSADVVGSSALMTTTMVNQIKLEEALNEAGIRGQVKTMVGGAPVTQTWADEIGADIYAENARDAVSQLKGIFAK